METRPEWKPIGIYRITPLPILPIPPVPKRRVYKQFVPLRPLARSSLLRAPKKLQVRFPMNYGDLKTTRRQLEF